MERPGDQEDRLVGETLGGGYRVEGRLAQGGMGDLYAGIQTRLERPVALKLLASAFCKNRIARKRFLREAQVTASIDSPHVVDVLDVFETDDGRPCLVAERLDGIDLQRHLHRVKTLGVQDALLLAEQLGKGLEAAHRAGIVHRDIKPSNVFLCDDGEGEPLRSKLIDFGVASLAEGEDADKITRTGAVVGTPAYMAPEQVRGAHNADIRADIYGVGAVLYRALSGKPPYGGAPTQALAAILEGPPKPLDELRPDLPFAVVDFVCRAMERDARLRFQTGAELAEAAAELRARQKPNALSPARRMSVRLGASALAFAGTAQVVADHVSLEHATYATLLSASAAAAFAFRVTRSLNGPALQRGVLAFLSIFGALELCERLAGLYLEPLDTSLKLPLAALGALSAAVAYWSRSRPVAEKPASQDAVESPVEAKLSLRDA